jgi:hypothetical protein
MDACAWMRLSVCPSAAQKNSAAQSITALHNASWEMKRQRAHAGCTSGMSICSAK